MSTAAPKSPESELVQLVIEEGSAVDAPDNPPAKVALVKNKDGKTVPPSSEPDGGGLFVGFMAKARKWAGLDESVAVGKGYEAPRTVGQIMAMDEFREKFWKARMALVESMNSILECAAPNEVGPLMAKSTSEFTALVNSLGQNMTPEKRLEIAAIITRMTGSLKDQQAVKRRELVGAVESLEEFSFTPVFSQAATDAASPAVETNKESPMSVKAEAGATTLESVLAKMNPEERKLVEDELAAKAAKVEPKEDVTLKDASPEILKRLDAMASEIKELRADKAVNEIAQKARRIARDVPSLNVQDIQDQLNDAHKSGGKEGLERAERMLSGLAAMARKGAVLQETTGRARTLKGLGDQAPTTADDLVSVKARELMKSENGLSFERAYTKVLRSDQALATAAITGARLND